jgi:hypothetical protein
MQTAWLAVPLWLAAVQGAAMDLTAAESGIPDAGAVRVEAVANTWTVNAAGNSQTARKEEAPAEVETLRLDADANTGSSYIDNNPFQDFEVHFLVALPFSLAYSFALLWSMDVLVQGTVPPSMTTADMWALTGLAVGGAAVVALGSQGRVMDQSKPRLRDEGQAQNTKPENVPALWRVCLLRMEF